VAREQFLHFYGNELRNVELFFVIRIRRMARVGLKHAKISALFFSPQASIGR
jgi:hypothetical protein